MLSCLLLVLVSAPLNLEKIAIAPVQVEGEVTAEAGLALGSTLSSLVGLLPNTQNVSELNTTGQKADFDAALLHCKSDSECAQALNTLYQADRVILISFSKKAATWTIIFQNVDAKTTAISAPIKIEFNGEKIEHLLQQLPILIAPLFPAFKACEKLRELEKPLSKNAAVPRMLQALKNYPRLPLNLASDLKQGLQDSTKALINLGDTLEEQRAKLEKEVSGHLREAGGCMPMAKIKVMPTQAVSELETSTLAYNDKAKNFVNEAHKILRQGLAAYDWQSASPVQVGGSGSLSEDKRKKIGVQIRAMFEECLAKNPLRLPQTVATLWLTWGIDNDAFVRMVWSSASFDVGGLNRCLLDSLRAAKQPHPEGGTVELSFPFVFKKAPL